MWIFLIIGSVRYPGIYWKFCCTAATPHRFTPAL
jgi:hypothetical protein